MNEPVESARETFRKLAVFEIDPKKTVANHSEWRNASFLLEAADVVDEIFWRQSLPHDDFRSLLRMVGDDDELREMFLLYHGPYDPFNNDASFLPGQPEISSAGFYPQDLTREEFAAYIRSHQEFKPAFESPYTIITRDNSHLTAVPYHLAYEELIERLSEVLNSATTVERHRGFEAFLSQRAKDLRVDDYYPSETLWVRLEDNPIDLVIGPYEVYEDRLLGLKAAYEAILYERDLEESARISYLQQKLSSLCKPVEKELGRSLHVEDTNVKLSVANLIYAGGDARKAVPAIAFSLPNDERVIEEVGSRQVILRNVLEAKFKLVAQRIANQLLEEPLENEEAAFQDFFNHTLFHEVSHSIGPQRIVVDGEATTVNRRLRQYHSVLEEAKADALGACLALSATNLDLALFLKGYIGHFMRAVRFGLDQAHGGANAIQFNYLFLEGGFTIDRETAKLSVDKSRARKAVFKLAADILDIQARGDFDAAQRFVTSFRVITPQIEELIFKVTDFPIDIRIRYCE